MSGTNDGALWGGRFASGPFLDEDADRYVALGFTQFTLGFGGPDWTVENGRRFLEWRDRINEARALEEVVSGAA